MGDHHLTNETESQKDHHDFFHFTLELIMMAIVMEKMRLILVRNAQTRT